MAPIGRTEQGDRAGKDPDQPGFERRPQFRTILVCGIVGLLLACGGCLVSCAVQVGPSVEAAR